MAKKEDIDNINKATKAQKEFNTEVKESENLVGELSGALMGIVQELTRSNVALGEARKGYRSLLSNQQKVESIQLGLAKLSSSELRKIKQSSQIELQRVKSAADQIKHKKNLSEFEKNLLLAKKAGYAIEEESLQTIQKEIQFREKVEDQLGLTGAALENLNRIGIRALGGIGVNLGALQKDFAQAIEAAEKTAEGLARADKEGKLKVLRAALPGVGKALTTALVDPLTIGIFSVDRLAKGFNEVQQSSIEFGRLTGQTGTAAAGLNTRFATTAEVLKISTALTKELGININNAFSSDVLAAAAEIQNEIGLSAEQASKLAIVTQTTSKDFDSITNSIVDSVSAFNKVNKVAVSQGVILQDIANTSEDILVSFNNQPDALASAAAAARRLGLDLGKVDSIASSLLNFESSISNELEAQLLTGKTINLERAREFALVNDLEGLSNELFKNSASIAEFSSMNRIQQEAQARALGLNRQELAKIALQQSINLGLSDKALEAAAGVTAEDLKRVEIQERLQKSIQKVTQGLFSALEPLINLVSNNEKLVQNAILFVGALKGIQVTMKSIAGIQAIVRAIELNRLVTTKKINQQKFISNMLERRGLGTTIAKAAAFAIANPLKAAAGLAAAGAVTAFLATKATKVNDGVIGPDGGLVVSGPKGSYQLNSGDTVVAGTNLGGTPAWAERLIAAVERGGDVYIDGNKAGTAMALGSYKL